MKFFADTAEIGEIRELVAMGLLDGVTTNPSLVAKSGRDFKDVIPEVAALDADGMLVEGRRLAEIAPNVAVKVPMTWDGLKACRTLSQAGTMVKVTLCFTANQALLAAKAGASFISPFIGRLDDAGSDGMEVIEEIRQIYDNYDFETEILAASIRSVNHVKYAALAGADVATVPPSVLRALVKHPLTDKGIETFTADWKKTGQTI